MRGIRRLVLRVLVSVLVAAQATSVLSQHDRPNIILFYSDDAGYADFGFQGDTRFKTPNLDRVARKGIRFTSAYATASVCAPARAGLLTGRYQNRFGLEFNLHGAAGDRSSGTALGLPSAQTTMADLLRDLGYATGIIGKWGLGQTPEFHPVNYGFDEFYGLLGDYSPYRPGKAAQLASNYAPIRSEHVGYLTDAFGDQAVQFVQRHRDEPFFLYLAFTAPHAPLQPPAGGAERFLEVLQDSKRAANAAMLQSMDDNIGKVIDALHRIGLYENTLVIFANDNGGSPRTNGASNSPLRGGKGLVFEGGVRIPLLMQWPARLTGNISIDTPMSTLDILPTAVAAAGGRLPADLPYDGVDLLPFLDGTAQGTPHERLFWRVNWAAAVRHGRWKLIRTPRQANLLFDLDNDVGETLDLSSERPDIVAALDRDLADWERTMKPPLWEAHAKWKQRMAGKYRIIE